MKNLMTVMALFFTFTMNAFGHPPADMAATYDANSNSITVSLRHRTFDGNSHRISSYEVIIDGESLEFSKKDQDGNTPTETLSLGQLEIPENSRVTIIAKCSLFGSLKRDFYFENATLLKDEQNN